MVLTKSDSRTKRIRKEIYVHAQKDMNIEVKHDRTAKIDNDCKTEIKNDRSVKVDNNDNLKVKKEPRSRSERR